MPQLHLYVSDETADAVRAQAGRAGVPVSRYLAFLVSAAVSAPEGWPEGYLDEFIGSMPDIVAPADPAPEPVVTA